MTESEAGREHSITATVNRVLDDLHRSLDLADSHFFCECGHVGCRERIKLTRAEYASIREQARPVMAGAHAERGSMAAAVLVPHGP